MGHHPTLERQDMLLLLSLVASALAAPQMTYWPPYVVPHMYNQHPVVYAQHGVYPYAGYPTHYASGYPVVRNIWPLSLSNVKDSKASFETSTSTCGGTQGAIGSTACTVSGEVIFSQNGLKDVLCGNNGGLTMNLQGTGMKTGNKYKLFVSSTATSTEIVEITAPVVGANNGVNVYMCVDGYNVDGANSKTAVDGMYVGLMDTTSTAIVVACGTAVLA